MADDYTAAGKTFRSHDIGGKQFGVVALVEARRTVVGYGWDNDMAAAGGLPDVASMVSGGATHALVSVEGTAGGLRYREDGTNPLATPNSAANAGLFVPVGAAFVLVARPGEGLDDVRVIETDASVVINVVYYRVDQ